MSKDDFDVPGGFFNPKDHVGRLLLIKVVTYKEDYPAFDDKAAADGETRDGVEVLVTVLDGDNAESSFDQSTLHQGRLVGTLKGRVGGQVLGRLGKGAAANSKFAAPFVLEDPTEADKAVARTYLAQNAEVPF